MGSGIKYRQEFKDDLVRAVIEHSQPIRVVAEQAGVKPDTLRTWIHRARRKGLPMGNNKPSYEDLEAENKTLKDQVKRQNRLLETEKKRVEFLGKAALDSRQASSQRRTTTQTLVRSDLRREGAKHRSEYPSHVQHSRRV